jgi:putative transposase
VLFQERGNAETLDSLVTSLLEILGCTCSSLVHTLIQQRRIRYTLYVVHQVTVALHQLHQHYRDRFGIEASYRIKNQCRIRTTSKNPVTRLLFVALAFILVNLWVYLLWCFVSRPRRGGRVVYRELFSLKTMLEGTSINCFLNQHSLK